MPVGASTLPKEARGSFRGEAKIPPHEISAQMLSPAGCYSVVLKIVNTNDTRMG